MIKLLTTPALRLLLCARGNLIEKTFDWLEENFLCLREQPSFFNERDLERAADSKAGRPRICDAKSYFEERSRFIDERDATAAKFELNLVDAQETSLARRLNDANSGAHESGRAAEGQRIKSSFIRQQAECSLLRVALHRSGRRPSADAPGSTLAEPADAANRLELECESADLAVHLVQSLVIDRLRLDPVSSCLSAGAAAAAAATASTPLQIAAALSSASASASSAAATAIDNLVACCRRLQSNQPDLTSDRLFSVRPILVQFLGAHQELSDQEESECRILTELYESADYAKNLLQQLSIAIELNEL